MHPLHPYLAICNCPNILCCSHDFVSFRMDYLLHVSHVYLFICLVNFSFVLTQLEGCLFRELFLVSSGRTWCFFPGISILFMALSLSMCYTVHLPDNDSQTSVCLISNSWTCKNSKLWVLPSEILIHWIKMEPKLLHILKSPGISAARPCFIPLFCLVISWFLEPSTVHKVYIMGP